MREWRVMLGPFLIWGAHFLLVYGVASVADLASPSQSRAWLIAGLSASALALAALLVLAVRLWVRTDVSPSARQIGLSGCFVSLAATAWQSLPLFIST